MYIDILQRLLDTIDWGRLPAHIAIIMDGNGRWATERGLPRAFGHRAGMDSLKDIVRICGELKISYLTVYAFSTENWKRPMQEVNVLMDLLVEYLGREINELCQTGVRLNPIGRLGELPLRAQNALQAAVERTRANEGLSLNIALNYGGRVEIVDMVRSIAEDVKKGYISIEQIDEKLVSSCLYTTGQPDPDLLIRPSGDLRISNFMLWQLAYTEFWHTDILWPDFRRVHLLQALVDYQRRERRFGGLKNVNST